MTATLEAVAPTATALTIAEDQTAWTDQQVQTLARMFNFDPRAAAGDLEVFFHQAKRTGLDPFTKQLHLVYRKGRPTIQVGIDGMRLIARRAVDRSGGTLGMPAKKWCGPDGEWHDVWLSDEYPAAAKATVIRDGQKFVAVAVFREYVGLKTNGQVTSFWHTKPAMMIGKCAEAMALRQAFPQDLSGLYVHEEMDQASNPSQREDAGRVTTAALTGQATPASAPSAQTIDAEPVDADELAGQVEDALARLQIPTEKVRAVFAWASGIETDDLQQISDPQALARIYQWLAGYEQRQQQGGPKNAA